MLLIITDWTSYVVRAPASYNAALQSTRFAHFWPQPNATYNTNALNPWFKRYLLFKISSLKILNFTFTFKKVYLTIKVKDLELYTIWFINSGTGIRWWAGKRGTKSWIFHPLTATCGALNFSPGGAARWWIYQVSGTRHAYINLIHRTKIYKINLKTWYAFE